MKRFPYQVPNMNLCDDFIIQAKQVWNWLKTSMKTGIIISEESITDFVLLELQYRHPYEIITQKYTKRQESQTGCDWEWWFTSGVNWLGLRIQAKKLDSNNLEYPELDKVNKYGRQVDLLISNALQSQPKRVPLYVFYNYWDNSKYTLASWNCGTYPRDVEMLGCGLVDALRIKNVLNTGSKLLKDIAPSMYPWSCLVCCLGYSRNKDDLPTRAFNFIMGAFGVEIPKEEFITREAPSYVYKIVEGDILTEEEWRKIGINRITIIREKRENKNGTHVA